MSQEGAFFGCGAVPKSPILTSVGKANTFQCEGLAVVGLKDRHVTSPDSEHPSVPNINKSNPTDPRRPNNETSCQLILI